MFFGYCRGELTIRILNYKFCTVLRFKFFFWLIINENLKMALFDDEKAVADLSLLEYHIAGLDFAIEHFFFNIFAEIRVVITVQPQRGCRK